MNLETYIKDKFNIQMKDRTLLRDAFTHSSYVNEANEETSDYERLEFMGDAVLEVWVSRKLFLHRPEISEGQMTTMRSQLVCEKSCAGYLRKMGLVEFIRLGVGEEKSNGRNRESLLGDIFEAFIGALYIDQGFDAVSHLLENVIDLVETPELTGIIDYKTKLQELVQADSRKELKYQVLSEEGASNSPTFEVGVYLDEVLMGTGKEHSKKKAEQLAAKKALEKLVI